MPDPKIQTRWDQNLAHPYVCEAIDTFGNLIEEDRFDIIPDYLALSPWKGALEEQGYHVDRIRITGPDGFNQVIPGVLL